jgi:tRNA-modifying protein YgfZ
MKQTKSYRLGAVSVVDVTGADAVTIVHNLTTNAVKTLAVGEGRETFVTDVRGKTLGHVCLFHESDRLRMIGPAGDSGEPPTSHSEVLRRHIDRYTIREDATPVIRDEEFVAIVLGPDAANQLGLRCEAAPKLWRSELGIGGIGGIGDNAIIAYGTNWLGNGSAVLLAEQQQVDRVCNWLTSQSMSIGSEAEFHAARVRAGFPWFGIDLTETNLPQEADRDDLAISFTKGCYLGQETIARLDAMGQVQKKLVRWAINGANPKPDSQLQADGKTVGRLTSVTADGEAKALAIGYARRSHFSAGASAIGQLELEDGEFTAVVL